MSRVRVLIAAAVLMVVMVVELGAQAVDTIVPASGSVVLRRLWFRRGDNPVGESYYGSGIGSVGHVSSQDYSDFAVLDRNGWNIYSGAQGSPDTTRDWQGPAGNGAIPYPILGDFRGDGRLLRGFGTYHRDTVTSSIIYYTFSFYDVESGRLVDTPSIVIDPSRVYGQTRLWSPSQAFAIDMDQDGADELVVATPGSVWIYRGGSSFGLDTPAVVVRDTQPLSSSDFYVAVGRFNEDTLPDLMVGAYYRDHTTKWHFYFGGVGSPWNWNLPHRTVDLIDASSSIDCIIYALDCDGDGRDELYRSIEEGPQRGTYVYSPTHGKSVEARSFLIDDADQRLSPYLYPESGGYLNDSSRRYTMMATTSDVSYFFSGGPNGINHTYEATFSFPDVLATISHPLSDVDGDGWDDFGMANPTYGFNRGIAVIAAGGPEIPRDSQSSGVIDVAVTGKQRAVSLWPNPVVDELHIAWRGDLRPMPSRFEIYDLSGVLVARGEADPSRGEVLWRCATAPAGRYLLRVSDAQGTAIASVPFIKE